MPLTILHVTTGLADGGAEASLYRLCLNDVGNKHVVVSLMDDGKYGGLLRQYGIEVHALNMRPRSVSLLKIRDCMRLLRVVRPDVVHTWMYHGCLVGTIAARGGDAPPVVWGIHHARLDRQGLRPLTFAIMKLLAKSSRYTSDAIVYCARSAAREHRNYGYQTRREAVIPNGYDLSIFTPHNDNKANAKRIVSLGMVARWDPIKDHNNLFKALQKLLLSGEDFQVVLAGTGVHAANPELRAMLVGHGLEERVQTIGAIDSVQNLMRSIDLHILSSKGEAFPNVLAEAMACGTPCVTTAVGDAADIVGDTGWVVPPRDPIALAAAIESALSEWNTEKWRMRCEAARRRIEDNFSMKRMVEGYNAVWQEVLAATA